MKKFYAFTVADVAQKNHPAYWYQDLAAECFALGRDVSDMLWAHDCARWSAIARVKMGLVEADYDFG